MATTTADAQERIPSHSISIVEMVPWLILLAGAVADVATTWAGLHAGLVENNVLVSAGLSTGIVALVVFKTAAVAIVAASWVRLPRWARPIPAATIGAWWLAVAGFNAGLLAAT